MRFIILILILACCGLSGCGRKGPLEPSPSYLIENGKGQKIEKPREDKPFILDKLI